MKLALPTDFSIVGTVLALAVAILLLSGLALYVAFRLRETLRDEKGGSARAAKVAFLIGLLFLSGGVFYFFASGFSSPGGSSTTPGSVSITSSTDSLSSSSVSTTTSSTSTSSTYSSSSTSTISSQTSSTSTTSAPQSVSMSTPSCAGTRVTAGTQFTCSVTISDNSGVSYSSATMVSSGDFAKFLFVTCSESVNGGASSSVSCSGNTVALGSVVPNTIVLTMTIQAPATQGQYSSCVLTLNANGFSQPIVVTFSMQVTA